MFSFASVRFRYVSESVVLLGFLVAPMLASAWGQTGHRIVGQIAENHLTPKALKAVKAILGNESVALSSTWADFVKSDTAYKHLNVWHYINLPDNLSRDAYDKTLKNDTGTDAYTKIKFLTACLKNLRLSKDSQQTCLRLLVHIVGDIHQPFHVGKEEDHGGNKIKVQWFNQPTNLHAVWDDKLIEDQKLSYKEYVAAIDHASPQELAKWNAEPLEDWLYGSYQMAGRLYKENENSDQKLGYRYIYDHLAELNGQLLKGGIHLAALLNRIFG